jgi:hypothetical protein
VLTNVRLGVKAVIAKSGRQSGHQFTQNTAMTGLTTFAD